MCTSIQGLQCHRFGEAKHSRHSRSTIRWPAHKSKRMAASPVIYRSVSHPFSFLTILSMIMMTHTLFLRSHWIKSVLRQSGTIALTAVNERSLGHRASRLLASDRLRIPIDFRLCVLCGCGPLVRHPFSPIGKCIPSGHKSERSSYHESVAAPQDMRRLFPYTY